MGLLLGINGVLLVGLLVVLWRLHRLQAVLAIQKTAPPAAVHRAVKRGEPRRREPSRRSALDEFPSETSLEDPAEAPGPGRPRPSPGGRSPHRLAPAGR